MSGAEVCEHAAKHFAKLVLEAREVENEERALAFEEARRHFLPTWLIGPTYEEVSGG